MSTLGTTKRAGGRTMAASTTAAKSHDATSMQGLVQCRCAKGRDSFRCCGVEQFLLVVFPQLRQGVVAHLGTKVTQAVGPEPRLQFW